MCSLKKISSLLLAFVMVLGTIAVGAPEVNAEDDQWKVSVGSTGDYIWEGSGYYDNGIEVFNDDYDYATIISVKFDDTSVFRIKKDSLGDDEYEDNYFYLKPKKVGKAKMTVKFTTDSGEQEVSATIRVKAYPKPIKSLKINGKAVNTGKYKYEVTRKISKSSTRVKIKMAPKKGWKITNLSAYRATGSNAREGMLDKFRITKSQLLKGSEIKIPKKYKSVNIGFTMKKGKYEINYIIYLRR